MINKDCWRQPVPVDLLNSEDYDDLDFCVLSLILGRVRREEGPPKVYYHGNKKVTVHLMKGQTLFRVDNVAKVLGIDPRKIRRSIEKLKKWYTNLQTEAKPYGLIISVLEYDELSKMPSNMQSSGRADAEQMQSSGRTKNKIIENNKIVKTEESMSETKVSQSSKNNSTKELLRIFEEHIPCDAYNKATQYVIEQGIPTREQAQTLLERFASYWLEEDTRGKPRYAKQATYDVRRRLVTWINNAARFDPETTESNKPFTI